MKSGIYKITNLKNGKFYIGSSHDIYSRWDSHKAELKRGTHINSKLQNAWNFYGENTFVCEQIETVDSDKKLLLEREQFYLDLFRPYLPNIGYNICSTACGGDNFTHNPNKEIIRENLKTMFSGENNPMFGKKHTKNSILLQKAKSVGKYTLAWFIKIHGNIKGTKLFQERRQQLSNRRLNYSYNNGFSGIKRHFMTDDIKERISMRKRKMKLIEKDLIEDIVRDTLTIKQLEEKYGISKTTILTKKRLVKKQESII